jgi:hypothetical protein
MALPELLGELFARHHVVDVGQQQGEKPALLHPRHVHERARGVHHLHRSEDPEQHEPDCMG